MKNSILNYEYIKEFITTNDGEEVPYRWSHGATDEHLGDGLIIYTLINFFKLKTLVCLGSGGGYIKETTEEAYYNYFVKQDIKIDLLHIDANHTLDGVKLDFDLYSKIMNKGGIITIHDTDKDYIDNFVELDGHKNDDLSGPSQFIKTLEKRGFEVINFFNHENIKDKPSSTGLTIVRKK